MRYSNAAVTLFVCLVVAAVAGEDPKVAGACTTCQKEKWPGLYGSDECQVDTDKIWLWTLWGF